MNRIFVHYAPSEVRSIIANSLSATDLSLCPSFKEIGETSVDEIRELIKWAELVGDKQILFNNADLLSAECQNALLKTLEENDHTDFYFVAGSKKLLPTVGSRCVLVLKPADKAEFDEWLKKSYPYAQVVANGYCVADELYFFTGGNLDLADEIMVGSDISGVFRDLAGSFNELLTNPKEMLKTFGVLAEKSQNSFFANHRELVPNVISYMSGRLNAPGTEDLLKVAEKHYALCTKANYGASDFFEFLCLMQL